ncbi:MAG TPA: DNA polymerase/3'-5' exonuclease PolX [Gemmatimonadales bacterium]|jgi:DNA polymerase (family 10)|nr:DNA polymerase/3'-5' exonuclease PolX [Gemmatimonadales bacterium]
MQNPDIARLFDEVADLLEIQSQNPFRVRAYRNAARVVRDYPRPLGDEVGRGADLTEIPGIGEDLAEKISTIVRTGDLPLHKELAAKLPAGLLDLLRIPGLGPKRVKTLYAKLKVKSAADLKKALEAGKVRKLAGFGPKMEENVRAGLGAALHVERRLLLPEVETHATALVEHLRTGGGLTNLDVAGSYRRRLESIGDLDILVTTTDPAAAIERFAAYPDVAKVLSRGDTRVTVQLRGGLQVDLRVVEPAAYGAALMYFTGSKAHNIELRQIAQDKQYKLNEYGLYRGTRRIAGKTEEEVYGKLGLDWIPPELREARGEVALARAHRLPVLVTLDEIRGDLQMHTTESDGEATLDEMAEGCRARGYEYCAITDHSKRVTMALGLDTKRLRAQWKTIDAWNARASGFTILKSVELDILENGKLDLPDDVLREADYVVASIHYGMTQSERELTRRVIGAIEHPCVDAIGHPTGRRVGKRESYHLDFAAVTQAAADQGCLLELDGHPERMDLPDTLAAAAKTRGVRFVLSTDSHNPGNLANMRYAVDLARRAGLEAGDILNTKPLAAFKKGLKRAR